METQSYRPASAVDPRTISQRPHDPRAAERGGSFARSCTEITQKKRRRLLSGVPNAPPHRRSLCNRAKCQPSRGAMLRLLRLRPNVRKHFPVSGSTSSPWLHLHGGVGCDRPKAIGQSGAQDDGSLVAVSRRDAGDPLLALRRRFRRQSASQPFSDIRRVATLGR
jgi:hypothetical protein